MPYVDYPAIKRRITVHRVLGLLGWRCRRTEAGWARGPCPLHSPTGSTSDCFAANLTGWFCHGCRCQGDALRLWAEATGQPLYEATLELCRRLGIDPDVKKTRAGDRFRQ